MPSLWESKMKERKRVVLTDSWRRFLAAEWVMYWAATSPTPQRTPELMTWVFTGWTERQFWYQFHSFNIILILCYAPTFSHQPTRTVMTDKRDNKTRMGLEKYLSTDRNSAGFGELPLPRNHHGTHYGPSGIAQDNLGFHCVCVCWAWHQ